MPEQLDKSPLLPSLQVVPSRSFAYRPIVVKSVNLRLYAKASKKQQCTRTTGGENERNRTTCRPLVGGRVINISIYPISVQLRKERKKGRKEGRPFKSRVQCMLLAGVKK